MPLELSLLPCRFPTISSTVLYCGGLLEAMASGISLIESKYGRDMPEDFRSYLSRELECEKGEECTHTPHYGVTIETPYGEPLKCVPASKLCELLEDEDYKDIIEEDHIFSAVWAYLQKLPSDTKIALYWH